MADAKLLIIDDHAVVRSGMAEVIGQYDGLCVSGRAETAQEGLDLLEENEYDLAVVDLALEGLGGLDLIKQIAARQEALPMLVLSMQDEALYAERAVKAGARGYVSKDEPIPTLVEAIRAVLGGGRYVSDAVAQQMSPPAGSAGTDEEPPGETRSPVERLSDRELEVLHLLGEGHGSRAAAERLNLSPRTVESHRANIKRKLGLKDGSALMRRAALWVEDTKRKPSG